MTEEAMKELVVRMRTDEAFRGEVLAAEVGEDRLAFVTGAGYDCTAQELVDVTSALADDELDDVAGGVIGSPGQGDAPALDTII